MGKGTCRKPPIHKSFGNRQYTLVDSRLDKRESERVAKTYRGYGALVRVVEQFCSRPSAGGSLQTNWHVYVAEGKRWPTRHP
jgi:hypothetical protein